jgi:hypothetical protein
MFVIEFLSLILLYISLIKDLYNSKFFSFFYIKLRSIYWGNIFQIINAKPPIKGKVLESSVGKFTKMFVLSVLRIFIIIVAIILAKSFFLCLYLDNFSIENFFSYIYSLSSGLISIGVFTSNFSGYLLDKTPLNIKFKELWDILWINRDTFSDYKYSLEEFGWNHQYNYMEDQSEEKLPNNIKTPIYLMSMNENNPNSTSEGSQSRSKEFNLSSIDKLIQDQENRLKEFKKLLEDKPIILNSMSDEEKLSKLQDLFNETQKLRVKILADQNIPVTLEAGKKIQNMLNSLTANYKIYVEEIQTMEPYTIKKAFDVTNKYTKTNSKVLTSVFEIMRTDLKTNKPKIYDLLNKDIFNKYKNEADLSQSKLNNLKKEISTSLNGKNK